MTGMLRHQPISYREAAEFIDCHHKHLKAPIGHKFSLAVTNGEEIIGVIMVGRPVARNADDTWTLEVLRCCTIGGDKARNAVSKLFGHAWRAAKELGYKRLLTYTLLEESGMSMTASNLNDFGQTDGETWDRPNRKRVDKHDTGPKNRWIKALPEWRPGITPRLRFVREHVLSEQKQVELWQGINSNE